MSQKSGKKRGWKRLFSIVLAFAMIITLLPMQSMTVYAETTGSGTEADPYIISNTQELKEAMSSDEGTSGKFYKLSDSFDNTEEITDPLCEFYGTFDGNGKTVNVNISTNKLPEGLFETNSGTISNLNVEGSVTGTTSYVGGICGLNRGKIDGCINGAIVIGESYVGGISGRNEGNATIKNCQNHGAITAKTWYAGAITGYNVYGNKVYGDVVAIVENCENDGNVTCTRYKEYTGYDNSQVAYKKSGDGYKVIGKVGNVWHQIHNKDYGFSIIKNKEYSLLEVSLEPEIVSGGKILKFEVSIKNRSSDTISDAKVAIVGDTELSGCDRSTNKTNAENTIMTMSYNGISFVAFSKDTGFRIVNTDRYHHSSLDAPQVNDKCDSAYSAQWNIDSIAGGKTITRTFYMGCTAEDDDLDEIVNSVVPKHNWVYSVNGNTIEIHCTAENCPSGADKYTLALTANNAAYSGEAYNGARIEDNISEVTKATVSEVTYYKADNNGNKTGSAIAAPTNVGKYVAEVTVSDGSNSVSATAAFEITKAEQSATVSMSGYKYGENVNTPAILNAKENPAITYYYSKENKNTDGTEWKGIKKDTLEPGTYYMYAVLTQTDNYNAYTTAPVSFTVQGSNMSGVTAENVTKTYDGNSYGIKVNTGSIPNAKVIYGTQAGTYNLKECPAYKAAGTHVIYYKVDAKGYNPFTGSATVTINPKKVTVTVDNATKHIGKNDPKFTYKVTGLVFRESLKDIAVARTAGETAGSYDITATATDGSNTNYDVTFVAGKLTIEDHTVVVDKAVAATCTETGLAEGSHCTVCKEVLVAQTVVAALGHDWSEWVRVGNREKSTCSRCDQVKFRNLDIGSIEKDAEVAPGSPITEATLDNDESELIAASGIFTAEEKAVIENGADARVWLEISATTNLADADKQKVEAEAKKIMGSDISKVVYFDADLFKSVTKDGTTTKAQIKEPGTEIEVSVSLPESLIQADSTISRAYKIIRLHNGKVDSFDAAFDKETGTLTFKTDRFSTYVIAFTDTQLATGVTLTADSRKLTSKGVTVQLTATVTPDNAANKKVTWTSSDSKVATVDENGLVTAVANGTAIITATTEDGGKTATAKITVDISSDDDNNGDNGNNNNNKDNSNNNDNKDNGNSNNNPATTPDSNNNGVDTKKDNQSVTSPQTGDTSNLALWTTLFMASLVGLVSLLVKRRKENGK